MTTCEFPCKGCQLTTLIRFCSQPATRFNCSTMSNSGNAEGGKTNEGNTDVGGVHEDVECPICTQLFFKPVTCPCGHTLCRRCLLKVLDRPGPQCPMCRACFHTGLRDIPVSKVLENVLLRLYPDEYRSVGEAEGNVHGSTESGPRNIPLFVMLAIFPYERMCLNIFEPRTCVGLSLAHSP